MQRLVLLSVLLLCAPAIAQTTEPSILATRPVPTNQLSLVEYVSTRIQPHEPMYFLLGPDRPRSKFQFSLKYQVFNDEGAWAQAQPWIKGFHVAYTQTSLWDIDFSNSSPFFDSTYRPELMWQKKNVKLGPVNFDFVAGIDHESNGKSGDDSRTANHLYVMPIFTFGDRNDLFLTVAPKVFTYLGDFDDTPDIETYRGYADLRIIIGRADALQAAFIGRIGSDWDRGSVQMDVSYPLRKILKNNVDLYLHAQVFTGYGESLLEYDESDTTFRLGLSLVR
jgi:phospholipase A1